MVREVDVCADSTHDLIVRYQAGQNDAFSALFERYKNYVYRVALLVLRNGSEAEEAVQDTFIDVLRGLPRYRVHGPARFETWLYRVTVNRCYARQRRSQPPAAAWDELGEWLASGEGQGDPEAALQRREARRALWHRVDRLSDEHRLVVLLRYMFDLRYAEIAEVLGISEGTVKSRLHTAHKQLQACLKSEPALADEVALRA